MEIDVKYKVGVIAGNFDIMDPTYRIVRRSSGIAGVGEIRP